MTEAHKDVSPHAYREVVSADYGDNTLSAYNPLHLLKAKRLNDGSTLLTFEGGGTLTVRESIAEIAVVSENLRTALAAKTAACNSAEVAQFTGSTALLH